MLIRLNAFEVPNKTDEYLRLFCAKKCWRCFLRLPPWRKNDNFLRWPIFVRRSENDHHEALSEKVLLVFFLNLDIYKYPLRFFCLHRQFPAIFQANFCIMSKRKFSLVQTTYSQAVYGDYDFPNILQKICKSNLLQRKFGLNKVFDSVILMVLYFCNFCCFF